MPVTITLPPSGARNINNRLRELKLRLGNLTLPMTDIGEYLHIAHADRFTRQVGPNNQGWKPLSPAYRARKPRNQDKILVLYGHLKGLLHYNAGPKSLEFGSNRIYAATHQFGRGKIPARPFLGLGAGDRLEILHIVEDWLNGNDP